MLKSDLIEAFKETLKDPKVVSKMAESFANEVIKQKTAVNNDEDRAVKAHVIFADKGDTDATFMNAKDVLHELSLFGHEDLRVRTLGKSLLKDAKDTKQASGGRVYLIKQIIKDITKYEPTKAAVKDIDVKDPEEVETQGKDKKPKKKKDKKLTAEKLPTKTPEEAFDEPSEEIPDIEKVNMNKLIEAGNEYEDIDAMKEHLSSMSISKLIKYINKNELPVMANKSDNEDTVVDRIVAVFTHHMSKNDAEQASETQAAKDKKKKKEKSKKKNKSVEDVDLGELSKKDKKKKKKKKNKKK
jgi:hypothetical protein